MLHGAHLGELTIRCALEPVLVAHPERPGAPAERERLGVELGVLKQRFAGRRARRCRSPRSAGPRAARALGAAAAALSSASTHSPGRASKAAARCGGLSGDPAAMIFAQGLIATGRPSRTMCTKRARGNAARRTSRRRPEGRPLREHSLATVPFAERGQAVADGSRSRLRESASR